MRTVVFVAIAVAALVTAAVAFGPHGPKPGFRGGPLPKQPLAGGRGLMLWGKIERFADEIDLSEKQLEQIRQIRKEGERELIDLRAQLRKAELDLRDLMGDVSTPSDQIKSAVKAVLERRQAVELKTIDIMLQIRDVLSQKQREKLREVIKELRRKRREELMERRRMRRHPMPELEEE